MNKEYKKNTGTKNISGRIDFTNANIFHEITQKPANCQNAILIKAILKNANCVGVDFSGADLSGADLSGADLSGADLSGANLSGANLSGANLSDADLSDAKLFFADIRGVIGIDCVALRLFDDWYFTYRDPRLKCLEQTIFHLGL